MTPFFFGPPERQLFGAFHAGDVARAQPVGVLLCNPFGQEAIRTHRLLRVVADRLSRTGVHVLRFDYFGTGDSAGEDEQGEIDGWSRDVLRAHEELRRLSGASTVVWVGARLGATVALRAARRADASLRRLVLWDPVVDGPSYSQLLRTRHVERLEEVYLRHDPSWRRRLEVDPASFLDEASGFPVSAELHRQLKSLAPEDLGVPGGVGLHVIADPADAAAQQWIARLQGHAGGLRATPLPRALDWTEHEAMNGALVPAPALQALLAALRTEEAYGA